MSPYLLVSLNTFRFMGLLESDDPQIADIGLMMAGTKTIEAKEGAHAAG